MKKKLYLPNWFVLAMTIGTTFLVLFMFYIDEGFYNFNWMREPGAWFVFAIYWNIIFWPIIGIGMLSKLISTK